MRIALGYVYKFYEITRSQREYFLTASYPQDMELFELIDMPDGTVKRRKRHIVELELRELEGKDKFSISGFADEFHGWIMEPVVFQSLGEKSFLLLSQHLEDRVRIVIVRRFPI